MIVTIDTLRPDALSVYGNSTRTPFFEKMAEESTVFDRAFTVAPLTLPAHTSLLTGLYPPTHGVRNNGTFRASPDLKLLSEIALEHGFTTGAVIGGFPLAARFGLNQGFQMYDDSFSSVRDSTTFSYAEKDAESVRLHAQSWLQKAKGKQFFLWMHFFDPHHPYLQHGNSSLNPYLQEVLYVDEQLETFFDFLRTNNLLSETLVVVVADHGEAFGEHGEISHSVFVYNTTLHIPLLLHAPGYPAQRRAEVVRIIDIFPTVLELMNWRSADSIDGVSLVPLLKDKTFPKLDAYSETLAPALDFGWSPLYAIQSEERKYIEAPKEEFYDLQRDGSESKNLAASVNTDVYKKKIQLIQARTPPDSSAPAPSEEDRRKLESLGYLSSGTHLKKNSGADPKDRIEIARRIAELTTSNLNTHEKAKAYEKLIRLDPANPLLLLRYAEILVKIDRTKDATTAFQKVIALDYESAAAYNGLASVYFQQKKLPMAETMLQLAVQKNVADGETYYNLAEISLNRGEFNQALTNYGFSMNFPFLPALHRVYDLAIGFQKMGERQKSRDAARLFLKYAPLEMQEQRAIAEKLL